MWRLLLDHLIGAQQDGCGHVEAERLGGLHVDSQYELCRRLNRKIGRPLALEDTIDVTSRTPVVVVDIVPIGDHAAVGDEEVEGVERWQLMFGRKGDDQFAMERPKCSRGHYQATIGPERGWRRIDRFPGAGRDREGPRPASRAARSA